LRHYCSLPKRQAVYAEFGGRSPDKRSFNNGSTTRGWNNVVGASINIITLAGCTSEIFTGKVG
jgi:hypothetical protein